MSSITKNKPAIKFLSKIGPRIYPWGNTKDNIFWWGKWDFNLESLAIFFHFSVIKRLQVVLHLKSLQEYLGNAGITQILILLISWYMSMIFLEISVIFLTKLLMLLIIQVWMGFYLWQLLKAAPDLWHCGQM